jgi:uncharacterized protein YjeT (DUF2065 family)
LAPRKNKSPLIVEGKVNETATIFWAALCLLFAIEGILFSLFPDIMKGKMAKFIAMPTNSIRCVGLATAFTGVFALWIVLG